METVMREDYIILLYLPLCENASTEHPFVCVWRVIGVERGTQHGCPGSLVCCVRDG